MEDRILDQGAIEPFYYLHPLKPHWLSSDRASEALLVFPGLC